MSILNLDRYLMDTTYKIIIKDNTINIINYEEIKDFSSNKIVVKTKKNITTIIGKDLVVSCKVTLNEEYIEEEYASKRPTDDELYSMIWEDIKKVNKTMAPYKSIKKLEIKHEPFVKTTTMKIKRFEELKKDK